MKTKTEHVEPIILDFTRDKIVSDFLDVQSKNTRTTYRTYFKRVLEFTKEDGQALLNDSETWIKKIFVFQKWLESKGYSSNYIESTLGMLRGFFNFYRKPLALTKHESKMLNKRARTTEDFSFSRENLFQMLQVGNLKEKYVVACGKAFGLRSEDFAKLTYAQFRRLDLTTDVPISFGSVNTMKENVKAFPFLDSDAVTVVRAVLEANRDKKDSDRVFTSKKAELSVILRTLAKKSGVDSHGALVRFHCLRKFLCNKLSAVASESSWKLIIGKKTSESAYVNESELRDVFKRAMPQISVTTSGFKNAKVSELEETVKRLEQLIASQNAEIEILRKNQNTMSKSMANMQETPTMKRELFKQKERVPID